MYRSARYQRACFISSTLHVYMCHSSSRRADRWCSPDTRAITLRCTATSLAQIPCPPCCLHTRPAGAARFAFAGLAHVLPTRPPCPAARVGLAGLKRLCRASALAAGPSVRVSITSPATAADCVFPLASGNVFWRRHNRPGKYTHRQ